MLYGARIETWRSSGLSIIEIQHPGQPFAALNRLPVYRNLARRQVDNKPYVVSDKAGT